MRLLRLTYLVAIAAAASLPSAHLLAQPAPNGWIGKWNLNPAQSKSPPGETPPASLTTQIDRMDTAHVRWTTTITDANGQKDVQAFDTPGNGEFYSLDGDTMVAHHLSGDTVQSVFREATGQTDILTCTLAAQARQMNCNGVITHTDGSTVRYTDVFDRQ